MLSVAQHGAAVSLRGAETRLLDVYADLRRQVALTQCMTPAAGAALAATSGTAHFH